MACSDHDEFWEFFADLGGNSTLDGVICPFTESGGAGLGMEVFALVVLGAISLAYSVHHQSPAPLLVFGIFGGSIFMFVVPGIVTKIVVFVTIMTLTAALFFVYSRSRGIL